MTDITITLHNPSTGQSESMPMANTMTVTEVLELGQALLGIAAPSSQGGFGPLMLVKDGKPLMPVTSSLAQVGVTSGDLLAILPQRTTTTASSFRPHRPGASSSAAPSAAALGGGGGVGGGGLDFSNLLGGGGGGGGGAGGGGSSGAIASAAAPGAASATPVYFQGMALAEATEYNPHPKNMVTLLQTKDHLFKELRFRNPMLASKLENQPFDRAVEIWRGELVKGSIGAATAISQGLLKEKEMKQRMAQNADDAEAKAYFEKKKNKQLVDEQYHQAMQEYPESMGRVLMLYINAKINGHPLQAFVDSGAQMTIMSKKRAQLCGILHLVDTRFAGVAVGVGTGKILGKIHICQLQISDVYFPCSVTIMDDSTMPVGGPQKSNGGGNDDDNNDKPSPKDMDFLLGLDMLKRFNCNIDLGDGQLKFKIAPGKYLETPFLHEKDLDESKGGTKGFCATKANEELMAAQKRYEEEREARRKASGGGSSEEDMEE